MATIGISGLGLTGVLRMTWVQDQLAHVLDHSQAGETTGTWTGLACPTHGLSPGADVDNAMLQRLAAHGEIADLTWETPDDITAGYSEAFQAAIQAYNAADTQGAEQLWEQVQAIWSRAWSLNYAVLELLQHTGLTRFSPVKPQQWVVASFEHHTSPHGLPQPHIHNIVITSLTTARSALPSRSLAVISQAPRPFQDRLRVGSRCVAWCCDHERRAGRPDLRHARRSARPYRSLTCGFVVGRCRACALIRGLALTCAL